MDITELAKKANLSAKETQLLMYITENLSHSLEIGVRGIAARNYISTSTVMRLAKKMGYSGFVDMIYSIKKTSEEQKISEYIPNTARVVAETKEAEALAQMLERDNVLIFGQGFSEIVAEYIYKKLLCMGKKCWCVQTLEFETVLRNFQNKLGGVVIISKSGETPHMVEISEKARKSNTQIATFTGNKEGKVSKNSDIVIYLEDQCPFDKENVYPNNFFGDCILVFEDILRVYGKNQFNL